MTKTQGCPSACWELGGGAEEEEVSGGAPGTPYFARGGQFTSVPAVVSVVGAERCPMGFWERLCMAGLGQGR